MSCHCGQKRQEIGVLQRRSRACESNRPCGGGIVPASWSACRQAANSGVGNSWRYAALRLAGSISWSALIVKRLADTSVTAARKCPSTLSPHGRLQCATPRCQSLQTRSGASRRDPAAVREPPQAVAHDRREIAVHPARERQGESLLGMIHDGRPAAAARACP